MIGGLLHGLYAHVLRPLWPGGAPPTRNCRFEPTCSRYSLAALEQHGALAGSYLTVHRLLRCQPFCQGGHDPVPDNPPRLFSRLISPPAAPARASSSSSPEPFHD